MDDTTSTLFSIWICMPFALLILLTRLFLRTRIRPRQRLDAADVLCLASIPILLARWSFVHVVSIWGTNNIRDAQRDRLVGRPLDIRHREVGSQLTLAARVAYCSFVWLQKSILLLFYTDILPQASSWTRPTLVLSWTILATTFLAVQTTTFTECRPFHLYWTVLPSPGSCVHARVQLLVLGSLSLLTDALLIALPIPVVLRLRQPGRQKVNLTLLFSIGMVIMVVTAVRLPQTLDHGTAQGNRTAWVSVEILASAFVANAPAVYGKWKLRGRRKGELEFWAGGGGGDAGGARAANGEKAGRREGGRESEDQFWVPGEGRVEDVEEVALTAPVPVAEVPRCYLEQRGVDVRAFDLETLPPFPRLPVAVVPPSRMTHLR